MSKNHDILKEIHELNVDVQNRTMFLHGHTGDDEDPGMEFRSSNQFIKNFMYLDRIDKPIYIHQQNIGGDVSCAFMIYDIICNAKSHVTIICHGSVMSGGTLVLQAADERISMPNCEFMLHYGGSDTPVGDFISAKSYMSYYNKSIKKMVDIYAEKMQNSPQFQNKNITQMRKWIDTKFKNNGEWYLSSQESRDYGLIDKIIGEDCKLSDFGV